MENPEVKKEYSHEVIAVLVNPDHKVLLVQQDETSQSSWDWIFPTITVEDEEDFLQAVVRGVKDQLGITLPFMQCTELHRYTIEDMKKEQVVYLCLTEFIHDVSVHDGAGVAWFDLDKLRSLNIGLRGDVNVLPTIEKLFKKLEEGSSGE